MAKVKSEHKLVFKADGLVDSNDLENITIENDNEGLIALSKILRDVDGKYVEISIIATDLVDIPLIKD